MFTKTILVGIALFLAPTPALAVDRMAASLGEVDNLAGGDESAWVLPVGALVLAALIILVDSGDGSDNPTSP